MASSKGESCGETTTAKDKLSEDISTPTAFLQKWTNRYMHSLQRMSKWRSDERNFKSGDFVLLDDLTSPPIGRCPYAVVESLKYCPEGKVRSAMVRLSNGRVRERDIRKMILLEPASNRRRRRRRLKGIHSRPDTNRTGAEGLSFYYPRLLHCLDQMLAVMLLSQHRVSSSKTVRPRAPCGARCMGHIVSTWSAVCSEAPHSQFGEGARPHLCMDEWNRPTPVRRRLSLTVIIASCLQWTVIIVCALFFPGIT